LMVPSEALVPVLGGHKVYVFKAGMAAETIVSIGLRTDRQVEIVSGLNPGDTLITTGTLQLRGGMSVEVSKVLE